MSLDATSAAAADVTHTSRSIRLVTAAVVSVMVAGLLLATRWAWVSDSTLATAVAVVVWCYTVLAAIPLVVVMRRLDRGVTGVEAESHPSGATVHPFPTMHAKVS
ncbi:MAG: hypothetical protein ACRDO4_17620 [Nocardioides sp.]